MRFLPPVLLAVLVACAATAAPALAQADSGGEGGPTPPPPAPSVNADPVQSNSFDLAYIIRKGAPFACGQAADKRRNEPAISCRIEATITVKSAVASFLGLSSRTIASGVAGNPVDHLTDDSGEDLGRAYFLPLSSSVRAKLRSKRARALGVHIVGTVSAHTDATSYSPASDKVTCGNDTAPSDSCRIKAPKRVTWPAGDGELVCWRIMPWYLATPVAYGKMCPRPQTI